MIVICSTITTAADSAARLITSRRRGTKATVRASPTATTRATSCHVAIPSYRPQIENGDPRSRWKAIVRS